MRLPGVWLTARRMNDDGGDPRTDPGFRPPEAVSVTACPLPATVFGAERTS